MKTLSILRHAKAERPEQYPTDLVRPLTDRGRKDAMRMATVLADLEPAVDCILSSPSLRTRQTVSAVQEILEGEIPVIWDERIYEASVRDLFNSIATVPNQIEHILLIGHNPGLEELVSALCGGQDSRIAVDLPTAGLAHLTVGISSWSKIGLRTGILQWLIRPKLLRT